MDSFASSYLGTVLRPARTFTAFTERPRVGLAALAVTSAALVYSAFVAWMYLAGHEPSFTGNPIPAESYYLWQALFLPPWLLVAWAAFVGVAHGLSRALGSTAGWRATATALGFTLAVPLTWTYLVPEVVVFGVSGHAALVAAMRLTGPLTLAWWLGLTWTALRTVHRLSHAACAAVAVAALLGLVVVTALLVR